MNPLFSGVTLRGNSYYFVKAGTGASSVYFIGNHSPVDIYSANNDKLFLGADNQLYWPAGVTSYTLNSFRAYFQVGDGSTSSPVRRTVVSFGDGTTSVHAMDDGQWTMDNEADAWYDLSGRSINSQWIVDKSRLAPGVYIHNGRKVIVK